MLIEVHIIQNHAPSNLNRDDSGSPKSAIFGGYRRARISSQCLKRCYRTSKTFRDQVDALGMQTRSMPEEVQARLLAHAKTLTAEDQQVLRARFEEWAEQCQKKLAAILGKGGKETKSDQAEDEDQPADAEAESGSEEVGEDSGEPAAETAGKPDQLKQSVFWRQMELQALFDAYRQRIEWDQEVPQNMRTAFDDKGKSKAKDMVTALEQIPPGRLREAIQPIKELHKRESGRLDEKYKAPSNETAAKKKEREKKLKEAKAKNDENAAKAAAQLILERFDPKLILREAGLRPDGIPVDMALFGRMVASPLMHNVEASSQFAHAISTHEFAREFDLWTRVDDRRDKRLDFYRDAYGSERIPEGTDGMGDAEFTSACFYSYFNVDFDALVNNLTGKALKHDLDDSADREKAKKRACNAVIGLLKAAIFERPTGKFNSMATPSLPTLVLVEVRDSHVPVSYADAFAKPVDPKNEEKQSDTGQVQRVDLRKESAKRLIQEANRITRVFCRKATKRLIFKGGLEVGASLEKEADESPNSDADPRDVEVTCVNELVEKLQTKLGFPKEKRDA